MKISCFHVTYLLPPEFPSLEISSEILKDYRKVGIIDSLYTAQVTFQLKLMMKSSSSINNLLWWSKTQTSKSKPQLIYLMTSTNAKHYRSLRKYWTWYLGSGMTLI